MIEEQAVIIKIDENNILVEKSSPSVCTGCQQKSACTTQAISQLLEKKSLRIANTQAFKLGDTVMIAVDESVLLSASISMYLLPLIGLFIGAFSTDRFIEDTTAYKDFWVICIAFISFTFCLIGIKRWSATTRYTNSISIKSTMPCRL